MEKRILMNFAQKIYLPGELKYEIMYTIMPQLYTVQF